MSSPGAEDASASSDCSGAQDASDMAEIKSEAHADDADQKNTNGQNATNTQKPASNAKDPLRPRRKKARRACLACQRAHLTCSDDRPCGRCLARKMGDQCQDGHRKKAKYLHDTPDSVLQPPGLRRGSHFPHVNGHDQHVPGQDMGAAPLPQQAGFYTQPPSGAFYSQNTGQPHGSVPGHDASPVGPFNNTQPPISPQYSQANQNAAPNVASTVPQAAQGPVPQFGGPLFDPSDPALFNFDISSLNFGNHYGALEMGMLGHMSSGAADAPAKEKNMMNTLSRAASLYNQQMQYGENAVPAAIGYDQNGIPGSDWNAHHSRQGSMQMQTPNNTPIASNVDQGSLRHDSLHGPQAFVIGQGPASISSASPASTEVNVPYDTDNAMSGTQFFHNGQHQVHQNSVMSSRIPQENRMPGTALQPIPSNVIRKRRRDTKFIYEGIRNPHDYVFAFHRMRNLIERRYPKPAVHRIRTSMMKYRPSLITAAGQLNREDLIHQEQALQLSVIQIEESFSEVGVPSVVCRRSGEVVWMNKEFSILTGWERDVLLGRRPNLNVNTGMAPDPHSSDSTRATTTPVIAGQQDPNSNGTGGNYPVLIVELMDTRSAVEYLDDFADVAYLNTRGTPRRRVNMLRYMTKEDMARAEQENSGATNVRGSRQDLLKLDGNVSHLGEAAMARLGKNGLVDCMIQWQVKRDNFNMPMLVCMHVMPVLDSQPVRPLVEMERED